MSSLAAIPQVASLATTSINDAISGNISPTSGMIGLPMAIVNLIKKHKRERIDKANRFNEYSDTHTQQSDYGIPAFKIGGSIKNKQIQAEKYDGQKEIISLPNNQLQPTNASTSHENMSANKVTDVVPKGSYVFSSRNKLTKPQWEMLNLFSGGQLNLDLLSGIKSKGGISPAQIAEHIMKNQKSKSTPNAFGTNRLKQRNVNYLTDEAKKFNDALMAQNQPQAVPQEQMQQPMEMRRGGKISSFAYPLGGNVLEDENLILNKNNYILPINAVKPPSIIDQLKSTGPLKVNQTLTGFSKTPTPQPMANAELGKTNKQNIPTAGITMPDETLKNIAAIGNTAKKDILSIIKPYETSLLDVDMLMEDEENSIGVYDPNIEKMGLEATKRAKEIVSGKNVIKGVGDVKSKKNVFGDLLKNLNDPKNKLNLLRVGNLGANMAEAAAKSRQEYFKLPSRDNTYLNALPESFNMDGVYNKLLAGAQTNVDAINASSPRANYTNAVLSNNNSDVLNTLSDAYMKGQEYNNNLRANKLKMQQQVQDQIFATKTAYNEGKQQFMNEKKMIGAGLAKQLYKDNAAMTKEDFQILSDDKMINALISVIGVNGVKELLEKLKLFEQQRKGVTSSSTTTVPATPSTTPPL